MKVKRIFSNILMIKDEPVLPWVISIFFMLISIVIIAGMFGLFKNLYEIPVIQKILTWFVAWGVFGGALHFIAEHPGTKVFLNSSDGQIILERKSIFGKVTKKLLTSEIEKFNTVENFDKEGSPVYRPAIMLKSNEQIYLSMFWFHRKSEVEKIINEITSFLVI